jgi:iron complex outermembrane receptor protein
MLTFPLSLILTESASAQRAQDNAVTQAGDAFGTTVGSQAIGLYTPTSARGFSPTDASNVRIEGLYFDQQAAIDPYLFSGSDIRVGIAAQSYAFPSPSGIADLKLRIPPDSSGASIVLNRGPLEQASVEADSHYAPTNSLSVGLNLAAIRDFDYIYALTSNRSAISLVLRFAPGASAEFTPFFGYIHSKERLLLPALYFDQAQPIQHFEETQLPVQDRTRFSSDQITAGVIAKYAITESWRLRAGVFHSQQQVSASWSNLYLNVKRDGDGELFIDISPGSNQQSDSGDVRLTRAWSGARQQGELTLAIRARDVVRRYNDVIVDAGATSIYRNVKIPQPPPVPEGQNRDAVQQNGLGVNYSERWKNRVSLSLGSLLVDYHRKVSMLGLPITSENMTVALPTASVAADISTVVATYASYTRGLEDSTVAPSSAQNRGQAPPASPTWQADGGVRFLLQPHLQFLVGAFDIHKGYFSSDTTGRYRQLGEISARGIESSANWNGPEGLKLVAGACWLRPEVTRHIPELGGGGKIPVGPVPRTININIDYAPTFWKGWGATLQWTSLSSRVETSDDLYRLPPLATLNVSARYLFNLNGRSLSARLEADNITNATGLMLSTAYSAVSQPRRNYTLTFAADL